MKQKQDNCRRILLFLVVAAVLVNIKSIFTDYDIDPEYAVAMSYRMLQGDRMFLQMWEPHQTSAFLCTFLMWLYTGVTGTTTGIVLFLQSMGVLLQALVAYVVYAFMRKRVDADCSLLMSIFFLTVRPKDIVFPEYSNMQIWFSVLTFLCLLFYFEKQGSKHSIWWLGAASIFLCLEIISYPTCIVTYGVIVLLLGLYAEKKGKDILLFSLFCFLQGILYVLFFVVRMGLHSFVENVQYILSSDQSHEGIRFLQGGVSFYYFCAVALWMACCLVAAVVTEWIVHKKQAVVQKENKRNRWFQIVRFFGGWLLLTDVILLFTWKERQIYNVLFLVLMAAALLALRVCNPSEGRIVVSGLLVSLASFVGTALLTNLGFTDTLKYMVLATMVSFIPVWKILDCRGASSQKWKRVAVLLAFAVALLFRRGVLVKTTGGMEYSLLDMGGVIRKGPEAGIVSSYIGAHRANATWEEWKDYVKPGDRVLLASNNSIMYLYEDVVIGTKSTICTPTFDEMQEIYWELNPQHKPNVVVVECWYGDLREDEESWIMQWVTNNNQEYTYEDGAYWRYYRIEDGQ